MKNASLSEMRELFKGVYPLNKAVQRYYDMRARCYYVHHPLYPHYGARGISVEVSRDEFLLWFLDRVKNFVGRPSVSRIEYDKGYTLDNMELTSVSENTKELYGRRGNPSPWGTKLDDIQCLTVLTFNGQAKMLSTHYGVTFQAIRQIQRGINRKDMYEFSR